MQAPNAPGVYKVTTTQVGPTVIVSSQNATAVWRGFKAQRQELSDQLRSLEDRRQNIMNELEDKSVAGANRTGLEARVSETDKRIQELDKQLAEADANVARASAVPGAVVVERPVERRHGPPAEVYVLSGIFIVAVMFPISLAIARRIWRRGAKAVVTFPQELAERLSRLDQAVDSVAVEVERIGEGQRFVTRVMAEGGNRAMSPAMAESLPMPVRGEKARTEHLR